MTINPDWYYPIVAIIGVAFIAFVGKRAGWFKIIGGTNALLRDQNIELRNSNSLLREQIKQLTEQHKTESAEWLERHTQSLKENAKIQGQIDVLKSIPLVNIDTTLKEIAKFNANLTEINTKILRQLQSTAAIAEEDRDVLTNQNKHIRDEVNKMKKSK